MGSRVTRVMSFPPPNFQLPTPFHSRLRVGVDTDRQTDHHCIMPPLHGDISNNTTKIFRLNAEISMCHFDAPTVQNTGGRHNMPPPSQVDLWPFDLKVVSEWRMMWPTSVPILAFLLQGLSVLDLGPIYAIDRRQTSDAHHRLMPPPYGGHNNWLTNIINWLWFLLSTTVKVMRSLMFVYSRSRTTPQEAKNKFGPSFQGSWTIGE